MIKQNTMPNGIQIVTDRMSEVRSVTIGFWLNCGSRHDADFSSGAAHFIEHMLFKGTNKRTAKQLALEVDFMGGQMNAFTSAEYTCYYIKVLDTHLPEAFDLLADMFLNSLFLPSDIKKEQQVILQEYDMYEDSPEDLIQDRYFSYAWAKHPLGQNIIGNRKSIKAITAKKLEQFKNSFYTPDNLVISVAGNVEHNVVVELANKYFADLLGTAEKSEQTKPVFNVGRKFIKKEMEQLQVLWGIPGIAFTDANWYQANVFNNILGASTSSRFFQTIREEKSLAYFIYSSFNSYSDAGLFTVNAGVKPENSKQLINAIEQQINEIVQNGIMPDELKKAKEQINSNLVMGLESSSGRMNRMGKLITMKRPIKSIDDIVSKINNITIDEVNQVAQNLFKNMQPTILEMGPKPMKRVVK